MHSFRIVLASTIALAIAASAAAQQDDELERLLRQQRLAEAAQAKAEAELATWKARASIDTSELPQGSVSAEAMAIEPTLIAYEAARKCATRIADRIAAERPPSVLIVDNNGLDALTAYRAYALQLAALNGQTRLVLDAEAPKRPDCRPPAAERTYAIPDRSAAVRVAAVPLPAVASAAIGLLGLFRTDAAMEGKSVTVDAATAEALVAAALKTRTHVGIARLHNPSVGSSTLVKMLEQLQASRTTARLRLARADEELARATAAVASDGPTRKCLADYAADIKRYRASLADTWKALEGLLVPYESPGTPAGAAVRALLYAARLDDDYSDAYLLAITPVAAGGSTRTTRNLLRSNVSFSGGAILAYTLTSPQGELVLADAVPVYGGSVSLRDFPTQFGGDHR